MSPEVMRRKLAFLKTYCLDLREYAAAGTFEVNHYAVERLVQLIVECISDVASRWLASRGYAHCDGYAELMREAGARGMLSQPLSERLVQAAKMRNLLVHMYERIDPEIVQAAVPILIEDAEKFVDEVERGLRGVAP